MRNTQFEKTIVKWITDNENKATFGDCSSNKHRLRENLWLGVEVYLLKI